MSTDPDKRPQGAQRCRPRADQPPPFPFPGRETIERLDERDRQDSPEERDAHVLGWLGELALDPIRWVLIPTKKDPRLQVWVPADALSFGGVRLCCSMIAAQRIADAMGCLLPTAGIIAARNAAATVRIPPWTLGHSLPGGGWCNPGGAIGPWLDEQDGIEALLERADPGGTKRDAPEAVIDTTGKDYVLSPRLFEQPDRCAIFGWYQLDGRPIQGPVGGGDLAHHLRFFDYSHRVMIVRRDAVYLGSRVDLADVYRDASELVSYTGAKERIPTRHPGIPEVPPVA